MKITQETERDNSNLRFIRTVTITVRSFSEIN